MTEHSNTGRVGMAATALLALLIFGLASLLSDISRTPSGLCASCHTMVPQYYTWQASSHSNISCLSCHQEPGLDGAIQLGKDLARFIYRQTTNTYILPIRLFGGIDDESCLSCHTFNRQTSPLGDLIIPHQDHSASNVRCIACHDAVAHGNIAERRVAVSIPAPAWNIDEGTRQMARPFTAPAKEDCMSCHFNRQLELSCQDCHEEDKTPADHLADDFLLTHGTQARETAGCQLCHNYDARGRKVEVRPGESLTAYTRRNDFCLDCHRQRPASHQPDFRNHGPAATGREDGCLVCHDNQPQFLLPEASTTYCGACHPSPHQVGWQALHNRRRRGAEILPGQKISSSCFACHSRGSCLLCHTSPTDDGLMTAPGDFAPTLTLPTGQLFDPINPPGQLFNPANPQ